MDDGTVAAPAARQHGCVATWQIDATPDEIKARVRAGRWHRVHRRVHAIGHRRRDPQHRYMAAVIAVGPDAVLSHAPLLRCGASARTTTTGPT